MDMHNVVYDVKSEEYVGEYISRIHSLHITQENCEEVEKKMMTKRDWILLKVDTLLPRLDNYAHSWAVLIMLGIKSNSNRFYHNQTQRGLMITQICEFFAQCNADQVKLFPSRYAKLARIFYEMMIKEDTLLKGFSVLEKAIPKIRKCERELTSIHSDIIKLCWFGKIYKSAFQFLDVDITDISKEVTSCLNCFPVIEINFYVS